MYRRSSTPSCWAWLKLALALILALLPAAGAVPLAAQEPPSLPPGPEEPNDFFGAPYPLPLGESIQATLYPPRDADWFEFAVDHQGELTLALTGVPADLDLNVRVWNADREAISGWFAPTAPGGNVTAVVDLAEPGRYRVELVDGGNDAGADTPYTLTATFVPAADRSEPNNRFGEAAELAEAGEHANILPAGDADWYRLSVDGAGELRLKIGEVADELAISVRVWNAERETISGWASPLRAGGDTQALVDLPAAGNYFLEVAAESGTRSPVPYLLEWSFVLADDPSEPNNSFGRAAPLSFDEPLPATILPRGDADWFAFDVPQPGELNFSVTGVPGALDIDLRVWNSNRDSISGWFAPLAPGGDTSGFLDIATAGRYYFEVMDGSSDARAVDPYTITVGLTPALDAGEPNNRFGSASPLEPGTPVQATILPQGDADWLALELPSLGELTVAVTDVPDNLDISLRLWNSNRDTLSNWFGPLARGGDTTAVIDIPRAGRYTIELADGNYDARAIEPFTVLASFIPAADPAEPNDTLELASPISLDTPVDAAIIPANDADWYRLELDEAGDLYLLVTHAAPNLVPALRVWNEARQTISGWAYPLAAGGDTEAIVPIGEAGVYYVELVDDRRGRSIEPYRLYASLSEIDAAAVAALAPAGGEPGRPEVAEPIAAGQALTATEPLTATAPLTVTESLTATEALTTTEPVTTADASTVTAAPGSTSNRHKPPGAAPRSESVPESTQLLPGLTFPLPEGWIQVQEEGVWLGPAATPEELTAEPPAGARIHVLPADELAGESAEDAAASLLAEATAAGDVEVVEEPAAVMVGGIEGITFGVERSSAGDPVRQRIVYVKGPLGAYQFILEAPAAAWDETVPLLESALEGVSIE